MAVLEQLRGERSVVRAEVRLLEEQYAELTSAGRPELHFARAAKREELQRKRLLLGELNDTVAALERCANQEAMRRNAERMARSSSTRSAGVLIAAARRALLAVLRTSRLPRDSNILIRDLGDWLRRNDHGDLNRFTDEGEGS